MQRQLQIRFEMDIAVLGDFIMTNELVPQVQRKPILFSEKQTTEGSVSL